VQFPTNANTEHPRRWIKRITRPPASHPLSIRPGEECILSVHTYMKLHIMVHRVILLFAYYSHSVDRTRVYIILCSVHLWCSLKGRYTYTCGMLWGGKCCRPAIIIIIGKTEKHLNGCDTILVYYFFNIISGKTIHIEHFVFLTFQPTCLIFFYYDAILRLYLCGTPNERLIRRMIIIMFLKLFLYVVKWEEYVSDRPQRRL